MTDALKTGFFWHEKCFWHGAGNYAFLLPVGGLVEPTSTGFLPEAPETKRRMKNLIEVTGLLAELDSQSPNRLASIDELALVHPKSYLDDFKALSDDKGGILGLRTPFGPGGFEIASLSTGLVIDALFSVLDGRHKNAYALSRPPGHHCLPDYPNGFCLFNNIVVAVQAARKAGKAERVAIVDWDVHHGNGTEHIFYDDPNVLTISIHQERNYPVDSGDAGDTGGQNAPLSNMNIPLIPGGGSSAYQYAFKRLVLPKLRAFNPDIVMVACGFDASGVDPLSRMLLGAADFALLTKMLMEFTGGKLVMAHEGGYSETHVPFCGHAVLQTMSGAAITADDPLGARIIGQQPDPRFNQLQDEILKEIADLHHLS
ncbi:MAG: class II histone deacetylase [Candidatus Puniceispirillaceae bacterium]